MARGGVEEGRAVVRSGADRLRKVKMLFGAVSRLCGKVWKVKKMIGSAQGRTGRLRRCPRRCGLLCCCSRDERICLASRPPIVTGGRPLPWWGRIPGIPNPAFAPRRGVKVQAEMEMMAGIIWWEIGREKSRSCAGRFRMPRSFHPTPRGGRIGGGSCCTPVSWWERLSDPLGLCRPLLLTPTSLVCVVGG